jgi:TPP-dependent pyruvate/acetoin dehydrogenase alpha subunit
VSFLLVFIRDIHLFVYDTNMSSSVAIKLAQKIKAMRAIQLNINKRMLEGQFQIPIHLAIGHEAVSACLAEVFSPSDKLLLTHRNIHFQLAFGATEEQLTNEYMLKPSGLASGKLGSMNLMNPNTGNIYTSNILGNNFSVALGIAFSLKLKKQDGVVWIITGDGAIEEGAFYESVLIASSLKLPIIFVVENNKWSLGTSILERRIEIDLYKFADSMKVGFQSLKDNDINNYLNTMQKTRKIVAVSSQPQVLEVEVHSLGGFYVAEDQDSKRYINYHAGAIKIEPDENGIFEKNSTDPVFTSLENLNTGNSSWN